MRYNVGDRVRVRSDLVGGKIYDGVYMNSEMKIYRGNVFEICGVHDNVYQLEGCRWLETGALWDWSDEMLEPLAIQPRGVEFKWDALKKLDSPVSRAVEEYTRMQQEERFRHGLVWEAFENPEKPWEIMISSRRITPIPNEIESRKEIRKRLLKL